MKRTFTTCAMLLGMLISAANSSAAIVHDENADGDLSGVFSIPTALDFLPGANTVIGNIGPNGNTGGTTGLDADYFTVVVLTGETLNSIVVDSRTGAGTQSFFGYTEGSAFTGQGGGDIDGSVLFSNTSGEVLDDLIGGAGTLGPGTYSFWIQETSGAGIIDYSFTFGLTSTVPEPSSLIFGAIAVCGFCARRRR